MQNAIYSKAGAKELNSYRLNVCSTVQIPDDPVSNCGRRVSSVSCIMKVKWLELSMPLWMFYVLLVFVLIFSLAKLGNCMNGISWTAEERTRIIAESDHIRQNIALKQSEFDILCQENAIKLKAIHELGMQMPANETTTKISAPPTRYSESAGQVLIANNEV